MIITITTYATSRDDPTCRTMHKEHHCCLVLHQGSHCLNPHSTCTVHCTKIVRSYRTKTWMIISIFVQCADEVYSSNHFPQEATLSRHSPVVRPLKMCLNPLQTQTGPEIKIIPAFVVVMISDFYRRSPGGTTEELCDVPLLVSSMKPKFIAVVKKSNEKVSPGAP